MIYINITGFGATGSSAVVDLLKEYSNIGYFDKGYTYEHIFLWHPDALLETVEELRNNYFGLQTDAAIRKFINKMNEILQIYGGRYFFDNDKKIYFKDIVKEFIESISCKEGNFTSILHENNKKRAFIEKIFQIIRLENIYKKQNNQYGWYTLKVTEQELMKRTKTAVNRYINMITDTNKQYYLLDTLISVEYSNWIPLLFDNNMKNIIVMSDPRDRFLREAEWHDLGNGYPIVPMDPELYCQNYRVAMEKLSNQKNENYYMVYFEDLIRNYDASVQSLEQYIGLKPENHNIHIHEYFDITRSCKNMKMYERKELYDKYSSEINYIEENLKEFLVE